MFKAEAELIAKDNTKMYICCWEPDNEVKGIIAFIHGIGDVITSYSIHYTKLYEH